MIAVDTNVLVQYLVDDDRAQARRARDFLEARSAADPAFVSVAVVIETVRVLQRTFGVAPVGIATLFLAMLRSDDVVIEAAASIRRALDDALDANGDIADAIIAQRAIDAGCDGTVTLDRRAQRVPGMLPV